MITIRSTGKSRRLQREQDADRGIRRPGDPIVLVSPDQAAARTHARPRTHQRAARDVVGALNAAARRRRPARVGLFDASSAQRPSTRRHGGTRYAHRTPSAEQRRRETTVPAKRQAAVDSFVQGVNDLSRRLSDMRQPDGWAPVVDLAARRGRGA